MTDVFISYAREDKKFVKRLHTALTECERESWVDWDGIPPTAEWMQEINSAIEKANTFIFVISPDSVASEVCCLEIDHAVQQHKRLIPLVYREAPTTSVHSALSALNWIFFRDADDFQAAFEMLITALDTDLEWVRSHTRTLVRAKEWENNKHDKSYLLRGNDLKEAEEWLAQAAEKEPEPTALHSQYIIGSRGAETRRQRIMFSAVSIGFLIAIVLAVVAMYQRQVAETRHQVALARQLAAQSESVRQTVDHIEQGTLFAVEGVKRLVALERRDPHVSNALQENLSLLPKLIHDMQHEDAVRDLAFSPDGKYLASASKDDSVIIWNRQTGQPVKTLPYENGVWEVIYNDDGAQVAARIYRDMYQVRDVNTGVLLGGPIKYTQLLEMEGFRNSVHRSRIPKDIQQKGRDIRKQVVQTYSNKKIKVFWSGNARYFALLNEGNIQIYDVEEETKIGQDIRGGKISKVAFNSNQQWLAGKSNWVAEGRDKTVRIWEIATGREIARMVHDATITTFAFSPDGHFVVTGDERGNIRLWEVTDGSRVVEWNHKGSAKVMAFSKEGERFIAIAGGRTPADDGQVSVWDFATTQLRQIPENGIASRLAISADGKVIATEDQGFITIWDASTVQPMRRIQALKRMSARSLDNQGVAGSSSHQSMDSVDTPVQISQTREMWFLRLSSEGEYLVTIDKDSQRHTDNRVRLWHTPTGEQIGEMLDNGLYRGSSFAGNSQLVALSFAGKAVVWDVVKRKMVWSIDIKQEKEIPPKKRKIPPVTSPAFSPDGTLVAICLPFEKKITVSEAHTGNVQHYLTYDDKGKDWKVCRVHFSPTGQYVVVRTGNFAGRGYLTIWRVGQDQPLLSRKGKFFDQLSAIFSTNEQILAIYKHRKDSDLIEIWDVETFTKTRQIVHALGLMDMKLSFDGSLLATGSRDRNARVWDTRNGEELVRIAHPDFVKRVRFSPDGKYLSTQNNQTTSVWPLSEQDLIEQACSRLTRNLTQEEWSQYVGEDEPYRKTCSTL